MNTALSHPSPDFPLDWAEAVRIIQHWSDPPLSLASRSALMGDRSVPAAGISPFPHECLAANAAWQQSCQQGCEMAIQELAKYAPPVAALSLASLSGGYLLQTPLAAPLDLRAPDFAAIAPLTVTPRFTIPFPPIATLAAIAHPERIPPESIDW
ncbi:hypothetical protein [Trichothermofontia sp.]